MPEEKETYKYLGIIEVDTIKQAEMKEKIKKEYFRRIIKPLKTELHSRNLTKGINTWAVPLIRYSSLFFQWTREEIQQMDQRTRKLIIMHKALHTRNDIDRLYMSRKERGRGLASMQDSINANTRRLNKKKCVGRLMTAIKNNTDNTSIN